MEPEEFKTILFGEGNQHSSEDETMFFETNVGTPKFINGDLSNSNNPIDDGVGTVGDKADTMYCVIA